MAANAFSLVSLAIGVDEDYYPPRTDVIAGPADYEPRRSRIVMHETLHFWQQLTHGFLARLATEEWKRLKEYRTAGQIPPIGPVRHQYVAKSKELGFSVQTLHEALTRSWDMHICNPSKVLGFERESRLFTDDEFWARFDQLAAMGVLTGPGGEGYSDIAYELGMEGAGGRYAAPFRYLVERSSRTIAGIVFPIAAHFALQSADPLDTWDLIAPLLIVDARASKPSPIEDLWMSFYDHTRQRIGRILDEVGQPYLQGEGVIREEMATHPAYHRALAHLGHLRQQVDRVRPYHRYPASIPDPIRRRQAADVVLATPGISDHRALLLLCLPPPVVEFRGGDKWLLGEALIEEFPDAALYTRDELKVDAEFSLRMEEAWQEMLAARWG